MMCKKLTSAIVFVFFMVLAAGSSDDRTPEQKAAETCADKISAYVHSKYFVEKRLKSPASAKFPSMASEGVVVNYEGECRHTILSYVDAQNSFGAMIRTKYLAEVQYQKEAQSWSLIDLQMF